MERGNVIAFIETGTEKELEGIQIVVTILHYLSICPQMDYLSILLYFTIHTLFIVEKDDAANGYI